jgi:hypothetical protein
MSIHEGVKENDLELKEKRSSTDLRHSYRSNESVRVSSTDLNDRQSD